MANQFNSELNLLASARALVAVTPNDDADLPRTCRALYIGVSGDVALIAVEDNSAVTLKAVPVGILDVSARRVLATGTTATNLVAMN